MTSEAPVVTQALEYSRMADPEAWANAESGKHSRENNIRLAQANAMGKARYLSELLAGFSQSQFVEAAASENGENLLNALVGVLSDYPNHRQSADSHHRLIEALRDAVEVWKDAYEAWCNPPPHLAFSESAATIIEQDREAVRAAVVAEIVAWLREAEWPYRNDALIAAIEAGEYRNDT